MKLIIFVIFLFSASILFGQQEFVKAILIEDNVKVYELPNSNSNLIGEYDKNTEVFILRSYWNWYQIKIDGERGWTKKNNVLILLSKDLKVYHGIPPELIEDDNDNITEIKELKNIEENFEFNHENKQIITHEKIRVTQWGIVFGLNITDYTLSSKSIIENNLDHYFAGVNLLYNINPYISFSSGLFYSIKGIEFDYNGEILDFNIRYLELPLLLKYTFSGIQKSSFFMSFGPYLDFYLTNSLSTDYENLNKNIVPSDYGLHYSFGYQWALNPNNKLFISANYLIGTNSIFKEKIRERIYIDNFNLQLGLIF